MSKQGQREPEHSKTSSPCAQRISLVMHFFWILHFLSFFFGNENYGLTLDCQLQCPSQQAARHTVRQKNTHHWPATVSMETTVSFPSWETINSERT